ncbi:MAG: DUF6519 domain-containing protein, partial [Pseudomonadota bacterium]
MKGDISADLHAPEKRYSGARAQQGRVLTDSDFNAAMDIVDDALETLVRTLVCAAGTPDGGFAISAPVAATATLADGSPQATIDFAIAPGSFVLGGRAQTLNAPTTFLGQPDWISQALDPSVLPSGPTDGRNDLVYLESIVQPVRAVEDREIQERALSADTTTRLRPQLKVRVEPDTVDECVTAMTGLRATLAGSSGSFSEDGTELLSNARLSVSLEGPGPVEDPCAPRTLAGYLGAENQTIKVMLTRPGFFVWAYDHGEPLYRVQIDEASGEVVFVTTPRDPVLYPRAGQVIEILPWDARLPNGEKAAAPLGHLAAITGEYDPAENRIAYDGSLPPDWATWLAGLPAGLEGLDDEPPRYFYARIWREPEGGGVDQPVGAGVVLEQTGIELTFSGDGFPGDYWTASFRPDEPSIVVPWSLLDAAGAPPIGPRRFYAPLALLNWPVLADGAASAEVDDCRNRFRRLCQINGCCTYQVGDGRDTFGEFNDIQAAVDALPAEGGEICLLPGRHEGRVDLRDREGITIHGCGSRTIVATPDAAAAPLFRIGGSSDLTLRDFAIRTDGALAIQGERRTRRTALRNLDIRVTGRAIEVDPATDLTMERSRVRARPFAAALTAADVSGLGPLVYLAGEDLKVDHCVIEADRVLRAEDGLPPTTAAAGIGLPLNRTALGGLWIGGASNDIRILDNEIIGGLGAGITLGSVERIRDGVVVGRGPGDFGSITFDDDGCPQFEPPFTGNPPDRDPSDPDRPRFESAGPVTDLRIERNLIEEHGASGVTVAFWFVAEEDAPDDAFDDIEKIG